MGRFEGRSVLITGAARGQGRSHAVAFAREGASVAICDVCEDIKSVPYSLGGLRDLQETREQCLAEGAAVIADRVDVRDYGQVQAFVERAVHEHGSVDVLVPSAGIFSFGSAIELTEAQFRDMLDVNVLGVWHVLKAGLPHMVERQYGRVITTGSGLALVGCPHISHYSASKHAIIGLTKSVALEHGANNITANCVCPGNVGTDMIRNDALYALMSPDDPTEDAARVVLTSLNPIPLPWTTPADVSNVVLFLASEDARHITGAEVKVDLGFLAK